MSRSSKSSSSSTLVLTVAVLVVLGAALAIALFGGEPADGFDIEQVETPTVAGEQVTQQGDLAPIVTGESLLSDGEVDLPVAGEPTLLVFLAHWCPACNAELPDLIDWLDEGGLPDDVALRAVATGIDPARDNYPPTTWLGERDFDVETIIDKDDVVAAAYGLPSYPYWVAVDAEGRVVGAVQGQIGAAGFDQLVTVAQG